ncbi:hypothetical protein DIPPA_05923 [Diplonema papillatum]|nr:hypothetical protein DIPPA_05923 [Diplonema papillatum]
MNNSVKYKIDMKSQRRAASPGASVSRLRNTAALFSAPYPDDLSDRSKPLPSPSSSRRVGAVGPVVVQRKTGRQGFTIRHMQVPRQATLLAERKRVIDEEWAASTAVLNVADMMHDKKSVDESVLSTTQGQRKISSCGFMMGTKSIGAKKRSKFTVPMDKSKTPFRAGGPVDLWDESVRDMYATTSSRAPMTATVSSFNGTTMLKGSHRSLSASVAHRRSPSGYMSTSTTPRKVESMRGRVSDSRRNSGPATVGRKAPSKFSTSPSESPDSSIKHDTPKASEAPKTFAPAPPKPVAPTPAPRPSDTAQRVRLQDILGGLDDEVEAGNDGGAASPSARMPPPLHPPAPESENLTGTMNQSRRSMPCIRSASQYSDVSVPEESPMNFGPSQRAARY